MKLTRKNLKMLKNYRMSTMMNLGKMSKRRTMRLWRMTMIKIYKINGAFYSAETDSILSGCSFSSF